MGALDRRAPTNTLTITQLTVWRLWTVFCSVVKNALLAVHFLSREGAGVQGWVHLPPPRDDLGFSNTWYIFSNNWYSAKYGDMYDMYSQQFTLCYRLVKSLLLRICF